jgi:hypothetical protein
MCRIFFRHDSLAGYFFFEYMSWGGGGGGGGDRKILPEI